MLLPQVISEPIIRKFGDYSNLVTVILLEHVVMVSKGILLHVMSAGPLHVLQWKAAKWMNAEKEESRERMHEMLELYELPNDQEKSLMDAADVKKVAATVSKQYPQNYGMNPIEFFPLFLLPPVLQYFSISMYLYVPLAVGYLTFIQIRKNCRDHQSTMGFFSDADVVAEILKVCIQ